MTWKLSCRATGIVLLLGVSTCRVASFECLRQSTTYPSMASKPYSLSYFEHSLNWYISIHSVWRCIIIVFQEKTTIRSHYQDKTSIQVWRQTHILYHILNIARTGTFQYIHSEGTGFSLVGRTGGTRHELYVPPHNSPHKIQKLSPPSLSIMTKIFFRYFFNLCMTKANLTRITSWRMQTLLSY